MQKEPLNPLLCPKYGTDLKINETTKSKNNSDIETGKKSIVVKNSK